MPVEDEFDVLLKRCNQRLSEITLELPDFESVSPARVPKIALAPEPARPTAAVRPQFQAAPRALPPPAPAPEPSPVAPPRHAAPEPPEEIEVFPPLIVRARTPPPAPLPRVEAPAQAKHPAEPARARVRAAAPLAAAAVAVLAAFVIWGARRPAAEVTLSVAGADAMAVRPEGDLLVARGRALLTLSPKGAELARKELAAPVVGLRWTPGSLWSVDGIAAEITERRDGERPTIFHLNHVPTGLYAKGNTLWTQEKSGHAIHQYLVSRSILGALLQPLDLLELPGITAETFAFDDSGALWIVDGETRSLYKMRADGGSYRAVQRAALSPLLGPSGAINGLSIDGDGVWLLSRPADGGPAALRRISLKRLDWTAI
jgi:hypothetical protein